jgi:methionyl-tRNA synthetase
MKKKYITTAIAYANGPPHIGHAFEFVLADSLKRFYKLYGDDVFLLTGMDEHGQKIQKKAEELGILPIQLCDNMSQLFVDLDKALSIDFDKFIRTSELAHKNAVFDVFKKCLNNNDIYKGEYVGWYNSREETFVSEFDAAKTNYKDPVTQIEYIKMREPSYFFKLSKYQNDIIKFITENPTFINGSGKTNEILQRLEQPLTDISISRTTITWGIQVPENEDHVFYVWFDALVNYISGCPEGFWPADIHVIGKDIVWFHAVIWLAMLMSAKLPLPKQLVVHGFINDKDGRKMSKSLGNVVSPTDLIEKYPACAIRYYLLKENVLGDINFSEAELIRCHDFVLLETLGNLINRTFSMCHKYCESKIPNVEVYKIFDINELVIDCQKSIENIKMYLYVERVFEVIGKLNNYINETKIWEKTCDENTRNHVIKTLMEGIFIISHFLNPIVPNTSEKIIVEYFGLNIKLFSELTWNNFQDDFRIEKKNTILYQMIDKKAYEIRAKIATAKAKKRENKRK